MDMMLGMGRSKKGISIKLKSLKRALKSSLFSDFYVQKLF